MSDDALNMQTLLFRCYRAIEEAIYSDDGMDGSSGEELLKEIVPLLTDADQATLWHEKEIRGYVE